MGAQYESVHVRLAPNGLVGSSVYISLHSWGFDTAALGMLGPLEQGEDKDTVMDRAAFCTRPGDSNPTPGENMSTLSIISFKTSVSSQRPTPTTSQGSVPWSRLGL